MAFRAVVFDIGGVLQITPPLGTVERWEDRLAWPGAFWPPTGFAMIIANRGARAGRSA